MALLDGMPKRDPRRLAALVSEAMRLADRALKGGDSRKATEALGKVLRLDPDHRGAHQKLAALYVQDTNWEGLRSELEWNLKGCPADVAAYDQSYLSLLFGEMPKGWDQYEVRFRIPGKVSPERRFPQPRWQGESFADRTLLLHFEQGFGDTLMFVRFAPMVKARGGRVVLLAQKQLADVVATCAGIDEVRSEDDPLPPFDLQLPLMSLPQVFRTDLGSIPCDIPYLDVPGHVPSRQSLARLLAESEGRVRIGCSWAGRPTHARDRERSIPRELFGALGVLPEVAWHSFQYELPREGPLPGVAHLAPLLTTFSDTAYALSAMDLVITVDTALAHLAGAMGIPTLLLVHFQPDFRWLLHREDSPWYPSLRLYRQPYPGNWEAVIQRVIQDLSVPPGV